jgi:hypothetical protein
MSDEGAKMWEFLRARCGYERGAPGHTLRELACYPTECVRVLLVNERVLVAALVHDCVYEWFERYRALFGHSVWLGGPTVRVLTVRDVPHEFLYRVRDARSFQSLMSTLMDFAFGAYVRRVPDVEAPLPPPPMQVPLLL